MYSTLMGEGGGKREGDGDGDGGAEGTEGTEKKRRGGGSNLGEERESTPLMLSLLWLSPRCL